ncbi:LacI family DNA-binding transcriptional regulator [Sediminicola luteus]|uniref:HTH lacI-type domain-containing protein n=1 Tax=Sediminicola luteus TaxID=319238 RepID=A0A2A4GDD8_9FLAO|nr:LacI family DNA-binding transcriptional regulator [Sediminicola luteus]PCE65795.1 hypothetical protein B7P33_00365 [Sediminicola luteus]
MPKMTQKDIAAHFGVSVSTVSKALKDSYEIGAEMRHAIQAYAREHHYQPNILAKNLRNKQTGTIGVVVPNILNYFFTQVFAGIEKVADARGFSIVSCISDESYDKEVKTMGVLNSGMVDGVIISLAKETQQKGAFTHIQEVLEGGTPLTMIDRVENSIVCDKVIVDDFRAGYTATKHFLDKAKKPVALVSTIQGSSVGNLRLQGYKRALKEVGMPFEAKWVVPVGKDDDLEILLNLLLANQDLQGIICLDEISAIETLHILKRKKRNIPEEIGVIGFTDGRLSKYVSPALTTVSQHGKYIGETAAHMLIDRIQGKARETYETRMVETHLVVRESTL